MNIDCSQRDYRAHPLGSASETNIISASLYHVRDQGSGEHCDRDGDGIFATYDHGRCGSAIAL